ncbi:hypothetical protein BY996DRAFT_6612689 [Phakopsora pachyrhizi]|uniref:Uncharacterized protein n=1 Tax=Phakopsora pachyrhizi TaxID=170000 RepID=A0AAV0AHP7_PHAPC|nr:hypothetical protein BY996DRAFT_6612689 [Phakopsora pachyrhizi]CAH7666816.1 hypothetical protein PPACK8108_LOCUS1169 [Phakopsora pachyrhizi]
MHTYLPSSSSYSGYPPFCMAFVNSNHYVALYFKNVNGSIPAPPIDGWWLRKSSSRNKNLLENLMVGKKEELKSHIGKGRGAEEIIRQTKPQDKDHPKGPVQFVRGVFRAIIKTTEGNLNEIEPIVIAKFLTSLNFLFDRLDEENEGDDEEIRLGMIEEMIRVWIDRKYDDNNRENFQTMDTIKRDEILGSKKKREATVGRPLCRRSTKEEDK